MSVRQEKNLVESRSSKGILKSATLRSTLPVLPNKKFIKLVFFKVSHDIFYLINFQVTSLPMGEIIQYMFLTCFDIVYTPMKEAGDLLNWFRWLGCIMFD